LLRSFSIVTVSFKILKKERQQSSNEATLHFNLPLMILDVFLNGGDWSTKFSSRFLHVSFMVGKVALHQISTVYLILPCWSSFRHCSILTWWKRLDQAAHCHFLSP